MKKAIVLLSGGLDSTTAAAIAQREGYELYGLSFEYGQKHKSELKAAAKIAEILNFKDHKIARAGINVFGGSALTTNLEIPKNKKLEDIGKEIPVTYVPARNIIFLSYALCYADTIECFDIFIGTNAIDFSGYPDCSPEFLRKYEEMANTGMRITKESNDSIKIHAPLEHMTKKEIILTGIKLGIDYAQTVTCYDYDETLGACGECESCALRLNGFKEAGIKDPALYR